MKHTVAIAVLLIFTAAGFAAFRQLMGAEFNTVPGRPRRFVDAVNVDRRTDGGGEKLNHLC